jgi:hypothetical protein
MNRTYDYNGVQIAQSRPVQKLRSVKKTVHINSGDRDAVYPLNGDFVVYLPRVYENVVSIAITQAEFPAITNARLYDQSGVSGIAFTTPLSFFMNFEGLNKCDETAFGADRSAYVDSVFAKFQVNSETDPIFYTEGSGPEIKEYYRPAISKLDRLRVSLKLHGSNRILYWPTNFSFSIELEMLENSFDDYSSFETRVADRSNSGFFGC